MTAKEFDKIKEQLQQKADDIAWAKRPGYTQGNADVLHNFKTAAALTGVTPLQAWAVYFWKHIAAILSAAKDPHLPQAEALDGRFADAKNYLDLGYALIEDHKIEQEKELLADNGVHS